MYSWTKKIIINKYIIVTIALYIAGTRLLYWSGFQNFKSVTSYGCKLCIVSLGIPHTIIIQHGRSGWISKVEATSRIDHWNCVQIAPPTTDSSRLRTLTIFTYFFWPAGPLGLRGAETKAQKTLLNRLRWKPGFQCSMFVCIVSLALKAGTAGAGVPVKRSGWQWLWSANCPNKLAFLPNSHRFRITCALWSLLPTLRPSVLPVFPYFPPSVLPFFRLSVLPFFRHSVIPYFRPSVRPSFRPTVHLYFRPSVLTSLRPCVLPSFRSSIFPSSVFPSFSPSVLPFLRPSVRSSVRSFVRPFVRPFFRSSVRPSGCLFVCLSDHPSTNH